MLCGPAQFYETLPVIYVNSKCLETVVTRCAHPRAYQEETCCCLFAVSEQFSLFKVGFTQPLIVNLKNLCVPLPPHPIVCASFFLSYYSTNFICRSFSVILRLRLYKCVRYVLHTYKDLYGTFGTMLNTANFDHLLNL